MRASCSAEVVDRGGHQRAAHDATGDEGRERNPKHRAEAQLAAGDTCGGLPPRVVQQVAAKRGAHRGPQLPVKRDKQILVKEVPIDAHVTHELGRVCTLLGADRLCGGVINAADRGAHLVAGSH